MTLKICVTVTHQLLRYILQHWLDPAWVSIHKGPRTWIR